MTDPRVPHSSHDESVMVVMQEIRAFSDALDRMYGGMKSDMEMNATDLAALRMLIVRDQRDEAVSPHDLARHLRISTASTTKLLDRLTVAGHVQRLPHPHDRRGRVVVLTDVSRRAFFRSFGSTLASIRGVADEYSKRDLTVIARFMAEVSAAIDPA